MAEIKTSVIINATQEKVWDVISDIDNEPKFWKGTKEVRNISKDGNQISREITIAFRDQKCLQDVTIVPKESIKAFSQRGHCWRKNSNIERYGKFMNRSSMGCEFSGKMDC